MDLLIPVAAGVVGLLTALVGGLFGTLLANRQARALTEKSLEHQRRENERALEHQRLLERLSLYGRWIELYLRCSSGLIFSGTAADRAQAMTLADSLSALTRHLRFLEPDIQNSRTITAGMHLVTEVVYPKEPPRDAQEQQRLHRQQTKSFGDQLRQLEYRLTAQAGTRRLEHLSDDDLRNALRPAVGPHASDWD